MKLKRIFKNVKIYDKKDWKGRKMSYLYLKGIYFNGEIHNAIGGVTYEMKKQFKLPLKELENKEVERMWEDLLEHLKNCKCDEPMKNPITLNVGEGVWFNPKGKPIMRGTLKVKRW